MNPLPTRVEVTVHAFEAVSQLTVASANQLIQDKVDTLRSKGYEVWLDRTPDMDYRIIGRLVEP